MVNKVIARLASLGYDATEEDAFAIGFAVCSALEHVKHFCNIREIPDCLEHVLVDMATGNFLLAKQSLGQLTGMQIEQTVKKIQDGDATVEYASSVDRNATFNAYLTNMIHGHESELIAHRKLRW